MERTGKVLRFDESSRSGRIAADDGAEEFNFYDNQIGEGSGELFTESKVTYERSVNEKGGSVYSNIRTARPIDSSGNQTEEQAY